jgi:hypothetical protein
MPASNYNHSVITHTTQMAVQTDTGHVVIVTEYRADGCVTWRQA